MRQKSLLVSAVMLLGGSVAMAAIVDGVRQYPTWGDGQPTASEVVINADDVETTYQYLYNIGCEGFFRGANNYMTRATLDDTLGYRVRFVVTDAEAGTVALVDSVQKFSEYRRTFADGVNGIWVDNNAGANNATWRVNKNADKTFTISNDAFADVVLGGVKGDVGTLDANCTSVGIYLNLMDPATANFNSTWIAVNEEDYQAFIATRKANAAAYKTKVAQYEAALLLKAAIKEAEEANVAVDAQKAVYLNEDASVEDIDAATTAVRQAIAAAAQNSASASDPKNLSSLITNATFDNLTYEGWSGSGFGKGGQEGPCAERYNMTFDTWQQIDNMPLGVYALSASGFYRIGSTEDSYTFFKTKDAAINNCKLYAVNLMAAGNDTMIASIANPFEGIVPGVADITGNNVATATDGEDVYTIPNSMASAVDYFTAGYYGRKVLFAVSEGSAKIGAYLKEKYSGTDWCIFDNFALTYYGNGADAYQLWMDEFIAAQPDYDSYEYVTASVVADYKSTLLNYVTAADYAAVKANIAAITEAQSAVAANVAAWQAFISELQACKSITGDESVMISDEFLDWVDYVDMDSDDDLTSKEMTTEELIEKTKWLSETGQAAVQSGLKAGTDMTKYLKNVDFADGKNGWTFQAVSGGNVAVNAAAKCAEGWNNANFDIYQVYENAPVGVYEISVQGFYREGRGENAWKLYYDSETGEKLETVPSSKAFVYLNDNQTPLANVFDYQVTTGELYTTTGDLAPYTDPLGMYWYPNDMTAAGQAFDEGAYKVSAFGLVAKAGDPLRIGMKGNTTALGDSWAIFTRFKLTYQAFKADIIQPEFVKAVAALNAAGLVGSDIKAEVETLKETANAVDQTDGQAMFDVLAAIYALNTKIETSVELFKKLKTSVDNLEQAIGESQAVQDTKTEASTLYDNVTAAITGETYTDAQAEEAIAAIEAMITKLAIPDTTTASDDNEIKMTQVIRTPSFTNESEAASAEGWTQSVAGTLNYSGIEFYDKDFDIYQDLAGLPAGTYKITVQGFSRDGNTAADAEAYKAGTPGKAKLYATIDGVYYETSLAHNASVENNYLDAPGFGTEVTWTTEDELTYYCPNNMQSVQGYFNDGQYVNELIVKVGEGQTLRLGVKVENKVSAQWIMLDNFTLTYYGNASAKETATNIGEVASAKVAKVEKFNVNGQRVGAMQQGVTIVRTTMTDGKVIVSKVFSK